MGFMVASLAYESTCPCILFSLLSLCIDALIPLKGNVPTITIEKWSVIYFYNY